MADALDDMCAEIAADGWTEVACGEQPWEHVYRRAAGASAARDQVSTT